MFLGFNLNTAEIMLLAILTQSSKMLLFDSDVRNNICALKYYYVRRGLVKEKAHF